MKRVALAGFHHETNTFSQHPTTLDDFVIADSWPGLTRANDFFSAFNNGNIPTTGFLQSAKDIELIPLTWANAQPSGKVTKEAYETIVDYILEDIKKAGSLDALYLDLHGAMVCEHINDGEGELLRRIRKLVGRQVPIVISHDLHANVSDESFSLSDAIVSYRTYPHIDMKKTGKRAYHLLQTILNLEIRPAKSLRRLDFLIPITAQCSLISPGKQIYEQLEVLEKKYDVTLSFNTCFPLSDTDYTSPTILAYGKTQEDTDAAVDELLNFIKQQRNKFKLELHSENEAIQIYKTCSINTRPVIFADTQDNSGCGGVSNTMGIFKALVNKNIRNAAIAIIWDPLAAKMAHQSKIGQKIELTIGDEFSGEFTIENLTDGKFIGTGDFYKDFHIDLGKMVLLNYQGIKLIVSSHKMQAADQSIFRHMGLEATDFDLLVLKSSVHFRADFSELASKILIVESPGENTADLNKLKFEFCHLEKL